jgi:hypothetical protein
LNPICVPKRTGCFRPALAVPLRAHNGRPETAATYLKADLTAVGLGADLRHRRRIAPALLDFRDTYNATWLVERHGFRPPEAIRREQLQPAALAA